MSVSWIVLTDLDGTLLDACDFSVDAALPAIERLRAAGIPIVPVTSKTLAEVAPLADRLGIAGPAIVESGGAIVSRWNGEWDVIPLGVPVREIRARVPAIEARSRARLALFSTMSDAEAQRASGLGGEALRRARERQFDEPFLLLDGDIARVERAANDHGLVVREGARFLHLCGPVTKGEAVRRLLSTYATRLRVIALGDAPMDGEFLALADIPIIVCGRDGHPDRDLRARFPHALVTGAPAPFGWADMINSILDDPTRFANEPGRD